MSDLNLSLCSKVKCVKQYQKNHKNILKMHGLIKYNFDIHFGYSCNNKHLMAQCSYMYHYKAINRNQFGMNRIQNINKP